MSELVDRVASALCAIPLDLPGAGGLRGTLHLAPAQARTFARAAIEALSAPPRDVLDHMARAVDDSIDATTSSESDRAQWEAHAVAAAVLEALIRKSRETRP